MTFIRQRSIYIMLLFLPEYETCCGFKNQLVCVERAVNGNSGNYILKRDIFKFVLLKTN